MKEKKNKITGSNRTEKERRRKCKKEEKKRKANGAVKKHSAFHNLNVRTVPPNPNTVLFFAQFYVLIM